MTFSLHLSTCFKCWFWNYLFSWLPQSIEKKNAMLFLGPSRPCKINGLSIKVLSVYTSEFTITLPYAFIRRDFNGCLWRSSTSSDRLSFHCQDVHWATWPHSCPILKNRSNWESACLTLLWDRMLNFGRIQMEWY